MRKLIHLLACTLLLAFPLAGHAQATYPAKPIKLIVPFPPGAGTDSVARFVAQKLSESIGTSIVIDNRTGAGGAIGAVEAARAEPDGYTLLFVAGPFTTVAAASKSAGYDPIAQFTPVAPIAAGPLAFVVSPTVPANNMREFLALAKQKPGALNYGSAGLGSINHLALELLNARAGTNIVHVPYKGIAPATVDLLAGRIDAITASIPATLPYVAQNKVKVLAVTGKRRAKLLPDVPSWAEAGVPNADVINYWGIVAPAGTPASIVARLNSETQKVLAQPDVRDRLEKEGAELIPGAPAQLGALIEADLKSWKKLISDLNLQLE